MSLDKTPYAWLAKETAPAILVEAVKLFGIEETPGPVHNKEIMGWAKELGVGPIYTNDEIPWCGLFMGICAKRANLPVVNNPLWALSWSAWGDVVKIPMLGDILTFTRKGGGHVGIYVGEDPVYYYVLGGNQNNMVCVTKIAKSRLYAARRTKWKVAQPKSVRPIWLKTGGALSENEA